MKRTLSVLSAAFFAAALAMPAFAQDASPMAPMASPAAESSMAAPDAGAYPTTTKHHHRHHNKAATTDSGAAGCTGDSRAMGAPARGSSPSTTPPPADPH